MAIKNPFLPELMGDRFKALIQAKNLGDEAKAFYPNSPLNLSFQKSFHILSERLKANLIIDDSHYSKEKLISIDPKDSLKRHFA